MNNISGLSDPPPVILEEAVTLPFNEDDPKFGKILEQLPEPDQIKYIHLLKKPTKINKEGQVVHNYNEHIEQQDNDMKVEENVELPPPLGPVIAEAFDGTMSVIPLLFDDYFRLASMEIWDDEEYGENADLVTMDSKMKDAAPYNVFYNSLKHCAKTREQPYSVDFTDLLCPSLGKLKNSLHITYMVKIWWLLGNYAARRLHKLPMTIVHGYQHFPWPERDTMNELFPDIDYHFAHLKKKGILGHHHTKLSLFLYDDDSIRIMVGTANLFGADWEVYNNQLWLSPKCPRLPQGSSVTDGDSPTGFKTAILDYLSVYTCEGEDGYFEYVPGMQQWIDRVAMCDFRDIKVVLLFNVPGVRYPRANGCMLHYMGHILSQHCTIPAPKHEYNNWRIVAQSSSIGLVGKVGPEEWLSATLLRSLASNVSNPYRPTYRGFSNVQFSLIYASMENCLNGYLGHLSAACGKFEKGLVEDQQWLIDYMCQWKADSTERSRAMPHSKCYLRISPCWEKMAYYLLTSSNLSRSGWGKPPKRNSGIYIRSYEMGILFLPKFFGEEFFETKHMRANRVNTRAFPTPFDLPLTPYRLEDEPYCWDDVMVRVGLAKPKPKTDNDTKKESPMAQSLLQRFAGFIKKNTKFPRKKNQPSNQNSANTSPFPARAAKNNRRYSRGSQNSLNTYNRGSQNSLNDYNKGQSSQTSNRGSQNSLNNYNKGQSSPVPIRGSQNSLHFRGLSSPMSHERSRRNSHHSDSFSSSLPARASENNNFYIGPSSPLTLRAAQNSPYYSNISSSQRSLGTMRNNNLSSSTVSLNSAPIRRPSLTSVPPSVEQESSHFYRSSSTVSLTTAQESSHFSRSSSTTSLRAGQNSPRFTRSSSTRSLRIDGPSTSHFHNRPLRFSPSGESFSLMSNINRPEPHKVRAAQSLINVSQAHKSQFSPRPAQQSYNSPSLENVSGGRYPTNRRFSESGGAQSSQRPVRRTESGKWKPVPGVVFEDKPPGNVFFPSFN